MKLRCLAWFCLSLAVGLTPAMAQNSSLFPATCSGPDAASGSARFAQ